MKASEITHWLPIIQQEARRACVGTSHEPDDIVGDAVVALLEEELGADPTGALVRVVARRRIGDAVRAAASFRHGADVSLDEITDALADADDGDAGVDPHTVECLNVPSHEDVVIDHVSYQSVADFIAVLQAPPSRQARSQMRRRWLSRIRQFVTGRKAA